MENTYVGPFLIIKRLGKNRRQRVFHARQVEQSRDVALKFISLPQDVSWEKALERVQRETDELKKLRHINIAKIYGAGVHEEQMFFAAELVKGEPLADLLTRRGRLTTDLVVEYGRQIAEILRYLHREKLVHGSLTPDKLMVTRDQQIKLVDLRVCQAGRQRWDAPKRPQPDVAAYMAPEQFVNGPSERADFYANGVILYEMVTGHLPVEPDTIGRMVRQKKDSPAPSVTTRVMDCPVWLDEMIQQLLQPLAKNRPYSANAMVLAFEEIKKVDASKIGAASQIAGSFNALTAGRDKSEAQQLLGQRSRNDELKEPFYQTVPFLVGSLMLIALVVVWFALPPNAGDLLVRGRSLSQSTSPADWRAAVKSMDDIIQSESKYAQQAIIVRETAKRKLLVDLARRGMANRNFHPPATRDFVDAYELESSGQIEQARMLYCQIVSNTDRRGNKRHVFLEAQARYRNLARKVALPENADQLAVLVAQAKFATTPQAIEFARGVLERIYVEKTGEDGLAEVVAAAKSQLDFLNEQAAKTEEAVGKESPVPRELNPSNGR